MSKWIAFGEPLPSKSGKTSVWIVKALADGAVLGGVQWFSQWRRYTFVPAPICYFESQCLRDIADFCDTATKQHRAARSASSGGSR